MIEAKPAAKPNKILQTSAIVLFSLNLVVSIVIMLLPFREYLYGRFQHDPQKVLWVLFTFSLSFAIVHYRLAVTEYNNGLNNNGENSNRENSNGDYSKLGGIAYLVLGLLCAVEIFILAASRKPTVGAISTSLWWLFAITTLLGGLGVYLPHRAMRLKQLEKRRKAHEDRLKERRNRPIVLRFKAHRYYVTENKLLVYTD